MNKIGKIRRSQILSMYGPGAIIDFRSVEGAPVSAVAAGLEEWDNWSIKPGMNNEQVIYEPRLQRRLNVDGFRLPPVGQEYAGRGSDGKSQFRDRLVPTVRFPNWHFCPKCNLLQHTRYWQEDPGKTGLYCPECSTRQSSRKKVFVVPVRFVVTCENGHLDEFPWQQWIDHENKCSKRPRLKLLTDGAGLKGLIVFCTECKRYRSMDGAFSPTSISKLGRKCSGKRPWLPAPDESCSVEPKVVQRGASNIYFPVIETALDIPPWSDNFQEALGHHWSCLATAETREDVDMFIEKMIHKSWDGEPMTVDEMKRRVHRRLDDLEGTDIRDLRSEEYDHLTSGNRTIGEKDEFSIHPEIVPVDIKDHFEHIVRVERLREVRAIRGFTRLHPPTGDLNGPGVSSLSIEPKKWLPAIEVRGEGIFIGLNEEKLKKWETNDDIIERIQAINDAALIDWKRRMGENCELPISITPRFVLVHTLSHAFMQQLSLECGYSTSALRERLYVSEEGTGMSGVLIYTSTADADGTLGGLVRQGRADRVLHTLKAAIRSLKWCSSDPLCMKGLTSASEGINLAACHACVFSPETACEHFNRYLDRAMLIGTHEKPEIAFFNELLD